MWSTGNGGGGGVVVRKRGRGGRVRLSDSNFRGVASSVVAGSNSGGVSVIMREGDERGNRKKVIIIISVI